MMVCLLTEQLVGNLLINPDLEVSQETQKVFTEMVRIIYNPSFV